MSVDPISDEFPWVSTYNYAENEPIANIDLWGLQKISYDVRFDVKAKQTISGKQSPKEFIHFLKAEGKGGLAGAAIISPVDEVTVGAGLLSRVPGISRFVSGTKKLLGQAYDGLKSLFKSGDGISDLASGVSKTIHEGKQGKHIPGHNNFIEGRSELTEDAQMLLDDFQDGNVSSAQKINDDKTRVDFGKEIGNYVDPETGDKIPTSVGTVINSKSGAHIVPGRPKIE